MKGLFKLTFAAAAVFALASCTTDDLSFEKKVQQQNKGILVEVEDLIDAETTVTRSAYTPNGKTGTLNFNTGDQIKVTDGTLVKYDIYEFDGDAFVFDAGATGRDDAWIAEPEFASFEGNGGLADMEWDNAAKQAIGTYNINKNQSWGEDWETEGAFNAEIPLWGTAQADATYGVKVNLKYLTGVLKVNMENVPGNATAIRVTGWKNLAASDPAPMAGTFTAILANDDEINEEAVLVPTYGNTNSITVNCNWATKGASTFFIPLVAQKYGILSIEYRDKGGVWNTIKNVEGLTVERKKFYNLTKTDFDFAGDYPSDITALLEEKKASNEISIKMANPTQVVTHSGFDDNTITIPETDADITLDFNTITSGMPTLYFDAAGDYSGTLTIKAQNATSNITAMDFNLPNATIVIDGNFSAVNLGEDVDATYNKPNSLIAKALVIGGKGQVNNIYANAELGYGYDGVSFKLAKGSKINSFELEKNYKAKKVEIGGTIGGGAVNLDMTKWQDKDNKDIQISTVIVNDGASLATLTTYSDVEVKGGTVTTVETDGNVTISGTANSKAGISAGSVGTVKAKTPLDAAKKATKNILVKEEGKITSTITENTNNLYNLTVEGKGNVAAGSVQALTINGSEATVGTITATGNVSITDTNEFEAVSGTLTMTAGNTLSLNSGYVNTLSVNAKAGKTLTIQHGTTAGYTAIATISGSGAWKCAGTSIWNGKKVGEGRNKTTEGGLITSLQNTYAKAAKAQILTATELASSKFAATATLYSNIDLAGQNWTRTEALAGEFIGQNLGSATAPAYPTISNLALAGQGNVNVGLFPTNSAAGSIQYIKVTNITSNLTANKNVYPTGVGILIGNVANTIGVSNVSIAQATVGNTNCNNVGGLFGQASAIINLDKVNVTGLTLDGKYRIGGVVGTTTAAINIVKNPSTFNVTAINVPANFAGEPDIKIVDENNINYGTVGMVAGQADAAVNDASKLLTVNNLIKGNRDRLGYKMRWFNAGPNVRYYFGKRGDDHTNINVWIGRLTTDDGAILSVTTAADKTAFEGAWDTPTNCYSVKHDMYDALDAAY